MGEGKAEVESDNIDTCIEVWKRYDPDHKMKIPLKSALGYIVETVNILEARNCEEEGKQRQFDLSSLNHDSIEAFARNGDMRHMKHLWIVKELRVDSAQQVSFISSARQVLRLMSAEEFDEHNFGNLDVDEKILPKREREQIKKLERSMTKVELESERSIRDHIAVQKLQDRFRERKRLKVSGGAMSQGSQELRAAAKERDDCPELVVTDETSDTVVVPARAG